MELKPSLLVCISEEEMDKEELSCSSCFQLAREAVSSKNCGHLFCNSCSAILVERNSFCPICRIDMTHTEVCAACNSVSIQMFHPDKRARRRIDNLEVLCQLPHCNWKGRFADSHLHQHFNANSTNELKVVVQDIDITKYSPRSLTEYVNVSTDDALISGLQANLCVKANLTKFSHPMIALKQALMVNNTLGELSLEGCYLGDSKFQMLVDGLMASKQVPLTILTLKDCQLRNTGAEIVSRLLSSESPLGLTHLSLQQNQITSFGVLPLAEALSKNRTLLYLNLRSNSIDDDGVDKLSSTLAKHSTLTDLELGNNFSMTNQSAISLARLLTCNSSLVSLRLQCNNFSKRGHDALVTALLRNRNIIRLNAAGIGTMSQPAIINKITEWNQHHPPPDDFLLLWASKNEDLNTVKALIDYGTNIDQTNDKGESALAVAAAQGNLAIAKLLISEGADVQCPNKQGEIPYTIATKHKHAKIAALLKSASTLPKWLVKCLAEVHKQETNVLDMKRTYSWLGNSFGPVKDTHVQYIARVLHHNRFITSINLSNNEIGEKGANALKEILEYNRFLTSIQFDGNNSPRSITPDTMKVIYDSLERNKTTQHSAFEILKGSRVLAQCTENGRTVLQTLPTDVIVTLFSTVGDHWLTREEVFSIYRFGTTRNTIGTENKVSFLAKCLM